MYESPIFQSQDYMKEPSIPQESNEAWQPEVPEDIYDHQFNTSRNKKIKSSFEVSNPRL